MFLENYNYAKCCYLCEWSCATFDSNTYCVQDKEPFPFDKGEKAQKKWDAKHAVSEFGTCDNFKRYEIKGEK
jgi:hypothetical protein